MHEPRWRTVLCWGAVVTFLGLPFGVCALHLVSDEFPTYFHFSQHISEYKFIIPYYQSITALVFALAGLNSWDKRLESPTPMVRSESVDGIKVTTGKGKEDEDIKIEIGKK